MYGCMCGSPDCSLLLAEGVAEKAVACTICRRLVPSGNIIVLTAMYHIFTDPKIL